MNFEQLIESIEFTQSSLQQKALSTVNQLATVRNWLIGYYIVEFEQKGEERAKYGDKLLKTLSDELYKKKLKLGKSQAAPDQSDNEIIVSGEKLLQ